MTYDLHKWSPVDLAFTCEKCGLPIHDLFKKYESMDHSNAQMIRIPIGKNDLDIPEDALLKYHEECHNPVDPVRVSLDVNLTAYDISCILVGCFEGGSNYWIDKVETYSYPYIFNKRLTFERYYGNGYKKHDEKKYKGFASDYLFHEDHTLQIYHDNNTTHLKAEDMVKGYGLYCEAEGKIVSHNNMDAGDYDSILQYALFGELIYG